jgi:hypothetical protein
VSGFAVHNTLFYNIQSKSKLRHSFAIRTRQSYDLGILDQQPRLTWSRRWPVISSMLASDHGRNNDHPNCHCTHIGELHTHLTQNFDRATALLLEKIAFRNVSSAWVLAGSLLDHRWFLQMLIIHQRCRWVVDIDDACSHQFRIPLSS